MPVTISATLDNLTKSVGIEPNLILKIDGLPTIYGARPILTSWKLDDGEIFDGGLYWDLPRKDPNSRDYISLKGTTKNVTNQILPDKGATSSINSMNIELINKELFVTKEISFSGTIDDILTAKASVYLSFEGASHPEDSVQIFRGLINDVKVYSGNVVLTIASGEELKRQNIYTKRITELTSAIDVSITSIPVTSTEGFFSTQDDLTQYIRIEDEIMLVASSTSTSFNVIRGQLGSVAVSHDETEVESYYRLQGDPVNLALKLMLSNVGNTNYRFYGAEVIKFTASRIYFESDDIVRDSGVCIGDEITISGAPVNNGTYTITGSGQENEDSYLEVSSTLTVYAEVTSGEVYFKSQYNVLPDGLGLAMDEVDIAAHQFILDFSSSGLPEYDFYLKDTINGKEFIDTQLFFPAGLYTIPRRARVSVKRTEPPLTIEDVPRLDSSNVLNMDKINQRRATFKNLYNTIIYKYNQGAIQDKYYSGYVRTNEESKARIKSGNKQFIIESDGLRNTAATNSLLLRQSQRFIDRYKFAARELSNVEVFYKDGFIIEVGDVVEFGGNDTQMIDLETGERNMPITLFEVIGRDLNFINGRVRLTLLETNFATGIRYGVVSLSSYLNSGNTTTTINLTPSFLTDGYATERAKWESFIGEKIRIHSDDYSYDQTTTITGLGPQNGEQLIVDTLPSAPPPDSVVYLANYNDSDNTMRQRFVYSCISEAITGVSLSYVFNCDTTNLFVGAKVIVHSPDYSRDSFGTDLKIVNISGNTVTLDQTTGFTTQVGDFIEGIGFDIDDGDYYGAY